MAEKLVEVTVKEDGVIYNGKGGFCESGDKIKVPEETAKSLKARKLV